MFDEDYFKQIWGTVHRHDYCEDLADHLISKYGKGKILDIGTGCGYLVKTLRNKGCDAWGLEISEYAIKNSCDPDHVRLGDMRNIPFASGFDVVHSQGVWEYIDIDDIQKTWRECKRVGKAQEHNIDYGGIGEEGFATIKTPEWWENQFYPKVLVACPIHELKEYAMAEWIQCVENLDYPNYDILLVDNSPTQNFYNRWKDKVNMIYLPDTDQSENASARINESMQVIQSIFISGEYMWWFNLEIDIIVPPNMLNLLLQFPSDWTSHDYQIRGGDSRMAGIGCSLLSRDIGKIAWFQSTLHGADAVLWTQTQNTHKTLTLTNWIDIKHMGTGVGSQ